jgi:UDP-glucose 4-epimerase
MASPQVWILVTGGAGFIGSHTVVELCTAGFAVVILDSLQNSSAISLDRIRLLVPRPDLVEFVQADILDDKAVGEICRLKKFSSVIHFAALKAVGESVADPLAYYRNNITGLLTLLQHVVAVGIPSIVFSSSATVYGDGIPPFTELSPTGTVSLGSCIMLES